MVFKWIISLLKPAVEHTKRSLPVLLCLACVLLIALIWWLGGQWQIFDVKPFSTIAQKMVATLLLFLCILAVVIVVLLNKYKKLDNESKQAKEDEDDPILPYERGQQARLEGVLKSLKENIASRNYLYKLPWFLVMGMEGAGKTSLINRSGQKFTLTTVERTSKRYKKADSSYKIDWWVSSDAVLIDPDGELLSQKKSHDQAQEEEPHDHSGGEGEEKDKPKKINPAELKARLWMQFVNWLESARSRRPLNGIVLVVDFPDLLSSKNSNREAMAAIFRTRINELIKNLGTRLPVYVVLNKLDSLSGFDVLFHQMSLSERETLFGFSFSLDKKNDVDHWLFEMEQQYEACISRLNEVVFDLLASLPSQSAREEAYSFVRQMDGAKEILMQYLAAILENDGFSTPAITRGVYFTSLFQQGVRINFANQVASSYYGMPYLIPYHIQELRQKTYFVAKIFYDVIYKESGLAADNQKVARQKRIAFSIASVIASVGAGVLLLGWSYYYDENKRLADEVIELTTAFSKDEIIDQQDTTGRYLLDPMDRIRKAALVYGDYREATPLVEDLGLYQGRKIGAKVDEAYKEILSKKFLPSLAVGLVEEMNRSEPGSDDSLSVLRVYRMFEDKNNRRADIAENWMADFWQKAYPEDGETQKRLMQHFSYAMSNVASDLSMFDSYIRTKQHELKQVPLERRIYKNIKQTADAELYFPLDFRNEIGPAFDEIYKHEKKENQQGVYVDDYQRYQISAFFTAQGFKEYFIPQSNDIMDLALVDAWVLGQRQRLNYSKEDQKVLNKKIREIYVTDYINTWRNGLNNLDIVNFTNIPHAVNVLNTMTGSATPLQRLLQLLKEQSQPYPVLSDDEKAQEALSKDPNRKAALKITRAFSTLSGLIESKEETPPYIEEVIAALEDLHNYTKAIQDAPEMGKAALSAAKSRLQLEGSDPIFTLTRIANGLPEPLNKQLHQVADNTWKVILIAAVEELERKWYQEIYTFYQQRITNRYPFRETETGISINDFEEFFSPKGRLQTFYDDYLKLFLEDNKGVLAVAGGNSLVRENFLDNLQAAWKIQDAFFDSKGSLAVEFSLKPLGLSGSFRRSVLDIDGQLVNYNHGPSYAARLIWPNTLRDNIESKLTLVKSSGRSERLVYSGTWSWFKLLDKAGISSVRSNSVDLRFKTGQGVMSYRLSADDANNPFIRQPFNHFSLPEKLLNHLVVSHADDKDVN